MKNKPKIEATGRAEKRERREGDAIRLTTFIPIKIRKRGGRAVVVRPAVAEVQAKTVTVHDQPLLTALSRAFYWQQLLDDGVVDTGIRLY